MECSVSVVNNRRCVLKTGDEHDHYQWKFRCKSIVFYMSLIKIT